MEGSRAVITVVDTMAGDSSVEVEAVGVRVLSVRDGGIVGKVSHYSFVFYLAWIWGYEEIRISPTTATTKKKQPVCQDLKT